MDGQDDDMTLEIVLEGELGQGNRRMVGRPEPSDHHALRREKAHQALGVVLPNRIHPGTAAGRQRAQERSRAAAAAKRVVQDLKVAPSRGDKIIQLLNQAKLLVYAPRLEPFGYAPLEAFSKVGSTKASPSFMDKGRALTPDVRYPMPLYPIPA